MRINNLNILCFAAVLLITVIGCKKQEVGFLSPNLLYSPFSMTATKGRVATSASMQVDGSTGPFTMTLLQVRNKYTNKVADSLTKEFEIATYKGEITQADTTLAQLSSKLGTSMYKPFTLNPLGGRIELSPATNFIDTGTFVFDVEVSNIAGKRTVNNAGEFRLVRPASSYDLTRQAATTSPILTETPTTAIATASIPVTITRAAGENKIIIKFLDKNGKPFSPATGQVLPRANLPHFANYDPYYPEKKTDSTLEFQYPTKTPAFPLFQYSTTNFSTGAITNRAYTSFYRIPGSANDLNLNINPEIGFRLWPVEGEAFVSGTWTITFRINTAARKP
jgi:hypothetical protein